MKEHKHILLKALGDRYYCPLCKGEFECKYWFPKLTWIIGIPLLIAAAWFFIYNGIDATGTIVGLLFSTAMWITLCRQKKIVPVKEVK